MSSSSSQHSVCFLLPPDRADRILLQKRLKMMVNDVHSMENLSTPCPKLDCRDADCRIRSAVWQSLNQAQPRSSLDRRDAKELIYSLLHSSDLTDWATTVQGKPMRYIQFRPQNDFKIDLSHLMHPYGPNYEQHETDRLKARIENEASLSGPLAPESALMRMLSSRLGDESTAKGSGSAWKWLASVTGSTSTSH